MAIHIIAHPFDKVIGFRINEKIEAKDIDKIVKIIEKKLEPDKKINIYAEVENWSGMSLEAFVKDLQFSLKHIQDFDKEVIVSDSKWLEKLATISNSLFSSIEVRHFSLSDKDKAWEFVGS